MSPVQGPAHARDAASASQAAPGMLASILVRTRNEAGRFRECLDAIFRQKQVAFEVLVLDSGSTDGTVDIARQYDVWLMHMPPEHFTYGYALNVGFEAASHPYLVALSGHSIPRHERWLANLLRHFEDPEVAGTSGPEVKSGEAEPSPARVELTAGTLFADPRLGFSNFNSAIRRDAWKHLPFHERLPYGEDKEWAWRMLQASAKIVVDAEAAVLHEHHESPRDQWRRGWREACAQATWRGTRRYSLLTALRLGGVRAFHELVRGRRAFADVAGAFAYYHGRYAGFAHARRQRLELGPRLLPRPRGLSKTASRSGRSSCSRTSL
jgi:rhamnosyltransferase